MSGQDLKAVLGKNIKFLRFRRQFSQADLAEKADISITFLSNIERGIKFPKADTLSRLAGGLDVEVYELFRPEPVPTESRDLVDRLSEDVTRNLNQTLEAVFRQYRG
jgi:transcriptional regulator with XRE-family HTH domain